MRLRPATDDDRDFLRHLFEASLPPSSPAHFLAGAERATLVNLMFQGQQRSYSSQFGDARHEIIEDEQGQAIGRRWVGETEQSLILVDIALTEAARGQGLGAALIATLQQEAQASGRCVELSVAPGNPAQALYERLGFVEMGMEGPLRRMRWSEQGEPTSTTEDEVPEELLGPPIPLPPELIESMLRSADFTVGQTLGWRGEDSRRVEVRKVTVLPNKLKAGDPRPHRRPFSIEVFIEGDRLPQGRYELDHEGRGSVELFLVAVEAADGGLLYESIQG